MVKMLIVPTGQEHSHSVVYLYKFFPTSAAGNYGLTDVTWMLMNHLDHYCLCSVSSGLVPDKEVRVSVKALAVSCVGAASALHPEAFFNSLYLEPLGGTPPEGMDKRSLLVFNFDEVM